MTNLVFPTEPYDAVRFFSNEGESKFSSVKAYKLGL